MYIIKFSFTQRQREGGTAGEGSLKTGRKSQKIFVSPLQSYREWETGDPQIFRNFDFFAR